MSERNDEEVGAVRWGWEPSAFDISLALGQITFSDLRNLSADSEGTGSESAESNPDELSVA